MNLKNFIPIFVIFLSVIDTEANSHFEELDKLCQKFIHFESVCYFYDFSDDCYPWDLRNCKLLYYSAHEPNCITYHCQADEQKIIENSWLSTTTTGAPLSTTTSTPPTKTTTTTRPTTITTSTTPSTKTVDSTTPLPVSTTTRRPTTITTTTTLPRTKVVATTTPLPISKTATTVRPTSPTTYKVTTTTTRSTLTTRMSINDNPCDNFDCYIEMISKDYCEIPVKGPFDIDCFIPCLINNCTITYQSDDLCPIYVCQPKPGPPPPPGPTPPGPTPPGPTPPGPTPPGPSPPGPMPSHLALVVGVSVGATVFGILLIWLSLWIVKKCKQTRRNRVSSVENPIIRQRSNPVDPDHVEEAFYDDGIDDAPRVHVVNNAVFFNKGSKKKKVEEIKLEPFEGPFVIADSTDSECSSKSSKVSLDELCPLAQHHVTQSSIAELRQQGANSNIIQNFVESVAIIETQEII